MQNASGHAPHDHDQSGHGQSGHVLPPEHQRVDRNADVSACRNGRENAPEGFPLPPPLAIDEDAGLALEAFMGAVTALATSLPEGQEPR